MSEYPLPKHAAHIWVQGDTLWLGFPPLAGGEHGHSVPFPLSESGLKVAIATLRERSSNSLNIGTAGSPTKWQIERELRHDRRYNEILAKMQAKPKNAVDEILEGLI